MPCIDVSIVNAQPSHEKLPTTRMAVGWLRCTWSDGAPATCSKPTSGYTFRALSKAFRTLPNESIVAGPSESTTLDTTSGVNSAGLPIHTNCPDSENTINVGNESPVWEPLCSIRSFASALTRLTYSINGQCTRMGTPANICPDTMSAKHARINRFIKLSKVFRRRDTHSIASGCL